jgi:hypothetical protein
MHYHVLICPNISFLQQKYYQSLFERVLNEVLNTFPWTSAFVILLSRKMSNAREKHAWC